MEYYTLMKILAIGAIVSGIAAIVLYIIGLVCAIVAAFMND